MISAQQEDFEKPVSLVPTLGVKKRLAFVGMCVAIIALVSGLASTWLLQRNGLALFTPPSSSDVLAHSESLNSQEIFAIEMRGDGANRITAINPQSLQVNRSLPLQVKPNARLSPDGQTLYLFDTDQSGGRHTLSAIDAATFVTSWQVDIPCLRSSFTAMPNNGIWVSADGKFVYLQATTDDVLPHIFVVDTQSHKIAHDFQIPLPLPAMLHYPLFWKLPWAERLAVLSGNNLLLIDLNNGQQSSPLLLPGYDHTDRVPSDVGRGVSTYGSIIDPVAKRLLVATSAQEIVAVDLGSESFSARVVHSLPEGWRFAGEIPLLLQANEKSVYALVHRPGAVKSRSEPDEVWAYDSTNWSRLATSNAGRSDVSAQSVTSAGTPLDPTDFFAVSTEGLLTIQMNRNNTVSGRWLKLADQSLDSKFYVLQ